MDKIPSKETGFYYMIYMKGLGSYYKCWIDGNKHYELYTAKDLLDIASRVENHDVIAAMKSSFRDSSVFIWMVDEGRIERLRPDRDTTQVTSVLVDALRPKQDYSSGIEVSWDTQFQDF